MGLVCSGGLLDQFTWGVLEGAFEAELTEHGSAVGLGDSLG